MKYVKCRESVARAMILWLPSTGSSEPVYDVVRPAGRHGWEARHDWLVQFVTTVEYRNAHVATQDSDPDVLALRAQLDRLGWPAAFKLPELRVALAGGRRVHGLLGYLGYESDPNPVDRQGRWFVNGQRVRGYRRTVKL